MAKSTKPMTRIHDIETDEIIDREMNDAEFAIYEANLELQSQLKADAQAKAIAKDAILDRLGLTAEEAALLLS